ncbi:MAG TPA: molybdopterin-dependent oxidoreductase [Pseudothermotoga sp.]|nr:molybdopterin-dependent oxidoreductase [Pseudothermotoga sp.]HOK83166.1 molybdopterin-dependent oxidoreductase [Pseudothermotoga sp.]HPP69663.1 molybdopterin-dependent oxidoreductase [Pseudothermotoga sp.]
MRKEVLLFVAVLLCAGAVFADAVLTVTGVIALKNTETSYEFTLDELKKLKGTTYVVQDPWMGECFYQGIELIELLNYVGYPSNAKNVVLICSDKKEFVIAVKDAKLFPIMLAYANKGRDLPQNQGGPLKLVYPISTYPELEKTYPKDNWAWWVVGIRVEM